MKPEGSSDEREHHGDQHHHIYKQTRTVACDICVMSTSGVDSGSGRVRGGGSVFSRQTASGTLGSLKTVDCGALRRLVQR